MSLASTHTMARLFTDLLLNLNVWIQYWKVGGRRNLP